MTLIEVMQRAATLPKDKQEFLVDFIEFLLVRYKSDCISAEKLGLDSDRLIDELKNPQSELTAP